jgi:hypothetical protein
MPDTLIAPLGGVSTSPQTVSQEVASHPGVPVSFRDLGPNAESIFRELFHNALSTLLPDLADAPWFVREREIVNLFVFRHLLPEFQNQGLRIDQIGIEFPLPKIPESPKERPGSAADILVWPHERATLWHRCRPLARIEWKNMSCRNTSLTAAKRLQQEDLVFLQTNQYFADLNYSVLTTRHDQVVRVECIEIPEASRPPFFKDEVPAIGDESWIRGTAYRTILSTPGRCIHCESNL